MQNDVAGRMEYIQKLFLSVETTSAQIHDLIELLTYLDTEQPEYRSIAYESASFVIGLRDLNSGNHLNEWTTFRRAAAQHAFHIDIGLGWALAKKELEPFIHFELMNLVTRLMVMDGMGYYHALYKGRNTLKNQVIPFEISGPDLIGFNQGIGRRLWYMVKGNVNELTRLIDSFPEKRHSDLWRGIGIAVGYVGGNDEEVLSQLSIASAHHKKYLGTGVMLAATSRIASNSVNEDIETACRFVCDKTVSELREPVTAADFN